MKYSPLSLLFIFCLSLFLQHSVFAQDSKDSAYKKPPKAVERIADESALVRDCSPFRDSSGIRQTPLCSDTRFWVDVSPGLDTGCTFVAGSPLLFTIKIDRYIGNVQKLRNNQLISPSVRLRLPVYDVDFTGVGTGGNPERDKLFLNGHFIGFLQGANNIWHLNEFDIPIEWINFPASPGAVANNDLRIDIDTLNGGWCTSADWGAVDIKVARPALFVHGIFSGPATWNLWTGRFDNSYGLPQSTIDLGFLPDTIQANAAKIFVKTEQLKQLWKVDKINLIGHSKGGLDSRDYAEFSDSVTQVIQIGTPNRGSPLADAIILGTLRLPPGAALVINAVGLSIAPGGYQLVVPYMKFYNQVHGRNPKVNYTALAGVYSPHPNCFFCIDLLERGVEQVVGKGDLIVPHASVHSLPYTNNLFAFSFSPNKEAVHTRQTGSLTILNTLRPRFGQMLRPAPVEFEPSGSFANGKFYKSEGVPPPPPGQTASQVGVLSQGQTQTRTIIVDQSSNVSFSLMYPSGDMDMALISPSGQRFDHANIPNTPGVGLADDEILGGKVEFISFNTLETGAWTVEINAVSVIEPGGQAAYAVNGWLPETSPIKLTVSFLNQNIHRGNALKLLATVQNGTAPVTDAAVTGLVQLPDNTRQTVSLFDDGSHGDTTPNDGVYSTNFTDTNQVGQYTVLFEATRAGGSPPFSRQALDRASVNQSTSTITGTFSDGGIDTNGNTLFDKLVIQTGLNISESGSYKLLGTLTDSAGNTIDAVNQVTLSAGMQTVPLEFDGEQLYRNRINGNFNLTSVKLLEEGPADLLVADERNNTYQTAAYQFLSFEHLQLAVTGAGSAVGVDTNANTLFDILRVTLEIDATKAGVYNWTGQVIAQDGTDLGFATGSGSLIIGTNNIVLNFDGRNIGQNRVNGPYAITGLLVYGQNYSLVEGDVLQTPPFTASQFEGFSSAAARFAVPDFDGDGRTDISVFRQKLGQWSYIRSSGNETALFQFGTPFDKIVPGDYTGDRKTDIAIWSPANGAWYILRSEDSIITSVTFGQIDDVPVPGDYDGDGKSDFAVFRPSNGNWYSIRSGDGAVEIFHFGTAGDKPLLGDYDGDGKSDKAIFRPGDNSWWILNSSNQNLSIITFGLATDKLVPADYTGDGKTDIAVWRPDNGAWYVLRSDNAALQIVNFGANGDVPVMGDYDGDGKSDFAVWRPADAGWYILRSQAGFFTVQFSRVTDKPVASAFIP